MTAREFNKGAYAQINPHEGVVLYEDEEPVLRLLSSRNIPKKSFKYRQNRFLQDVKSPECSVASELSLTGRLSARRDLASSPVDWPSSPTPKKAFTMSLIPGSAYLNVRFISCNQHQELSPVIPRTSEVTAIRYPLKNRKARPPGT